MQTTLNRCEAAVDRGMNKSQTKAVRYVREWVESQLNTNPKYGDKITEWTVAPLGTSGLLSISARREMMGLPEGNLLRFFENTTYLFFIRKRGKIEMAMGPKSLEQFHGRKFLGMHVTFGKPAAAKIAA